MPRVEAVVWDMDGTLVDSVDAVTGAYADAIVAGGAPRPTSEAVVAAYALGPPAALLTALLGRDCTGEDLAAYLDSLARRAASVRVHDGVPAALAAVGAALPMAVFTGASTAAAELLLGAAGLRMAFALVLGGDDVPRPKPFPDGLLHVCARLGADPARTAYVGDSPLDLECARRAGCVAVAAAWGHQYDPAAPRDVTAVSPSTVAEWVSRTARRPAPP
ncbi:MAG TPA: HAD family hydrolase [Mycobacteriales bacterium]|jgi:HAD superfamily hydrolase (TIGR01509 family)